MDSIKNDASLTFLSDHRWLNGQPARTPPILCEDEWSPLQEVIVGRAEHSHFPSEPRDYLEAIMPTEHLDHFRAGNPFPTQIVQEADKELNNLAAFLENRGVKVHRPSLVDWGKVGGYTSSMPRDALLVVGNTIIESYFAWNCRRQEIHLAYRALLDRLEASGQYVVVRAPALDPRENLYSDDPALQKSGWRINETRPAFDAADFVRCGSFLVGQRSHVTNASGVAYLQRLLNRDRRRIVLPDIDCPTAMHIDATFLPLRHSLAIYNPLYTSEACLRRVQELRSWDLVSIGHEPQGRTWPPLYMTSPEIRMNVLSLDEYTVLVEEEDDEMANLISGLGLEVVGLPFKHVQSLGGSFHCATVDLRRGILKADY